MKSTVQAMLNNDRILERMHARSDIVHTKGDGDMAVKSELLNLFLARKGEYLSGEELAEELGCSRTAIWKAVKQLREEGCEIAAVPNRGYAIAAETDVLSAAEICKYLNDPSKTIHVYQEIGSTNDELKQMALKMHAPAGSVAVSDYQTGGKGRLGRSFFSPKGAGLYLSVLLRPNALVADNLILTTHAAVAVYRAVKKVSGLELGIKWVNDLYLGSRKVCGILSEGQANFETGKLDFVVVGIGVNVFEPEAGYPAEIRDRAGSLMGKRSAGQHIDRNRLAAEIIREFYALSEQKTLASEYIEKNIVPGHEIVIIDGEKRRPAKAMGISEDGRLLIEEADGSRGELVYGEVSVRLAVNGQKVER